MPDTDDDAPLAELRRRVYEPGATAEDVRRYESALAALPVATLESPRDDPAEPGLRRPRRWWPRLAIAAVVLVALGTGVAVSQPAVAPSAAPTPTPIPVAAATRDRFVTDLKTGRRTELGIWLIAGPDRLPGTLTSIRRVEPAQFQESAPGGVDLRPSIAADSGGRLTVMVVADEPAPMDWEATRDIRDQGGLSRFRTVARAEGTVQAGIPATTTVAYPSGAPTRVQIDFPVGVRWSALALLSD